MGCGYEFAREGRDVDFEQSGAICQAIYLAGDNEILIEVSQHWLYASERFRRDTGSHLHSERQSKAIDSFIGRSSRDNVLITSSGLIRLSC